MGPGARILPKSSFVHLHLQFPKKVSNLEKQNIKIDPETIKSSLKTYICHTYTESTNVHEANGVQQVEVTR